MVTKDGSAVTGRLLNIDTFSIELLDPNENLRSFVRSDLRESAVLAKSTMPSYKDKLSAQELADVVSYLASLQGFEPATVEAAFAYASLSSTLMR